MPTKLEPKRPGALLPLIQSGETARVLDVRISYEIIKLFSEGLYRSPHKAVEELVSNAYDAGARTVHVLMPRPDYGDDSLWVVDDGTGMDEAGFQELWRIAHSTKTAVKQPINGRLPIGQFGIGKLAAYVLAWQLTHISKAGGKYLFTSMNFHLLEQHHQWEEQTKPLDLELRTIDEADARKLMAEIEPRDAAAWEVLFGKKSTPTWTAAALTDFKDLASKLREGTLSWVLRTGLPITGSFRISLNGTKLSSPKSQWEPIIEVAIGGKQDAEATKLKIPFTKNAIDIKGIGPVSGQARMYERRLSGGKSDQYGRSRGFFIRVRNRVINLDDELFGLDVLNHTAWAHFVMEVQADGLREHLLSSREGVRDSEPVRQLRLYLHEKFNACRRKFDAMHGGDLKEIDIRQLLGGAPSVLVTEPLVEALQRELAGGGRQLFYIRAPEDLDQEAAEKWIDSFEEHLSERPFEGYSVAEGGAYAPLAEYDAATRRLKINEDHPFIVKLAANSKNKTPMTLFASSEILTDALVRHFGFDDVTALEFFESRDRILRLLAGDETPVAADVIRLLEIADQDETAMERAVGTAFQLLGFQYEIRGGSQGGTDGVLYARLGRQGKDVADYRIVFDAKTTDSPKIPKDKVDFGKMHRFMEDEDAQYAFVIGKAFQGEDNPNSALSREARKECVSVVPTDAVRKLVQLHVRYGVTLSQVRDLFDSGYTVTETTKWMADLEAKLTTTEPQVPLRDLLEGLEALKLDEKSVPTVTAVRQTVPSLKQFTPEKIEAVLKGVDAIVGRNWLELDKRQGGVILHQSPEHIIKEVERVLSAADLK